MLNQSDNQPTSYSIKTLSYHPLNGSNIQPANQSNKAVKLPVYLCFHSIFQAKPEARDKFFTRVRGDNIYSPEFRAHAARVMAGFDMTLSMLDDFLSLAAQLAHLNKQHIQLDVDAEYFDVSVQN